MIALWYTVLQQSNYTRSGLKRGTYCMPFVKKNTSKGSLPPDDARKIFVGRANELHFFTEHILKPEDPAYNIISIYGDGGVGKSTLVNRYIEMVHSPAFQD